MSPEQASGQSVDQRSDLFSLGSVIYFMCTGRPPYRAESPMAMLNRICHEPHRPVDDVNPDVPLELAELVDRLLAKDPAERFATAREVETRCAELLAHMQQGHRLRRRSWWRQLQQRSLRHGGKTLKRLTIGLAAAAACMLIGALLTRFLTPRTTAPSDGATSTSPNSEILKAVLPDTFAREITEVDGQLAAIETRNGFDAAAFGSGGDPQWQNELSELQATVSQMEESLGRRPTPRVRLPSPRVRKEETMNQTARRALFAFVLGSGTLLTLSQVWGQLPGPPPAGGHDRSTRRTTSRRTASADQDPTRPDSRPPHRMSRHRPPHSGAVSELVADAVGSVALRGRHHSHAQSEAEIKDLEALHQAIGKLKSAKNDTEKTALTKQISQLLDKSFERDMQRREKQISDVETRVKKLRDQIEKRKKAKDDIISLRLKTIVNEADGLGFPEGADTRSGFGWQPNDFLHIGAMPFSVDHNDAEPAQGDITKEAPGEPAENESRSTATANPFTEKPVSRLAATCR